MPQLSEDAREELPGALTKMKETRGTLAHWVISSLSAALTILLFVLNQNYKSQISKLENKVDRYERVLIPAVNELERKQNAVEEKADTVNQRAEQNEKHFDNILNRVK